MNFSKIIKNAIQIKELPYGLLLLFGILSFLLAKLWDQKVLLVDREEPTRSTQQKCSPDKTYGYNILLKNISLDYSNIDSIALQVEHEEMGPTSYMEIEKEYRPGALRPETNMVEDSICKNTFLIQAKNLASGSIIRLKILSTSQIPMSIYTVYTKDNFKIEQNSGFHYLLYRFSENFDMIAGALIIMIIIYFVLLSSAKYQNNE